MRFPATVWGMMCFAISLAQESVPVLRGSSDASQRVFEQRISRPVPSIDTTVFDLVDVDRVPMFPGGETALFEQLKNDPNCSLEKHDCTGTSEVEVSFVVERNGSVTHPLIEKGACPELERFALCAITGLSAFTPGRYSDRTVRTRMRLPLRYSVY
jgi:hypothetical protein